MCDPVSLAIAAAVSTTISVVGEMKAAKAQNRAISSALQTQQDELTKQKSADLNENLRLGRKEAARIRVAAGESGLSLTGSVNQLLVDNQMNTTLQNERADLNSELKQAGAVADANSAYSRVQAPTVLGAGLQIATSAGKAYVGGGGKLKGRAS